MVKTVTRSCSYVTSYYCYIYYLLLLLSSITITLMWLFGRLFMDIIQKYYIILINIIVSVTVLARVLYTILVTQQLVASSSYYINYILLLLLDIGDKVIWGSSKNVSKNLELSSIWNFTLLLQQRTLLSAQLQRHIHIIHIYIYFYIIYIYEYMSVR